MVRWPHTIVARTVQAGTGGKACNAVSERGDAAGIPPLEIREAAGGDLIHKLLDALDTAARLDKVAPLVPEN
jgi:hypothetical protein